MFELFTEANDKRDTIYQVQSNNSSPVPIWAFALVSTIAVVLLALTAIMCCRLTRRTPPTQPIYAPRDPENGTTMGRNQTNTWSPPVNPELVGYYAPPEPPPAAQRPARSTDEEASHELRGFYEPPQQPQAQNRQSRLTTYT